MIYSLVNGILPWLISFYSLSFQNSEGSNINMSSYQGKKVLLVNIATGSDKVSQLAGLKQLQQQYADSLVVIVFPSNSFGHETRTDAEIRQFCQSTYNTNFIIASKSNVTGTGVNPVFAWLADKLKNGEMNAVAGGDFQKFLIDKDGMLVGVFAPKVVPLDSEIIDAITTTL
ncbi:MAG: glutathione peroxidase [Bacteroidetes bacterium]|nr:glutathione peroxidase [Bacteroidota bacterium]